MKERVRQFNATARGLLPGSIYVNMLPAVPSLNDAPGKWLKALNDTADVWARVNAITPVPIGLVLPLLLTGGYTLANFNTDKTALDAAFAALQERPPHGRRRPPDARNLWTPIYKRLVQYRQAVLGRFRPDTP